MSPQWTLERILSDRPAVRVNQLGYPTGQRLEATLIDDRRQPLTVELLDAHDGVVWTGRTTPLSAADWTSGQRLHLIEGELPADVEGTFRFRVHEHVSHPFPVGSDLYRPLVDDALRVLTLLRSGHDVDTDVAAGYEAPAGHLGVPPNTGDRAVPAWTGPDAERLYPG